MQRASRAQIVVAGLLGFTLSLIVVVLSVRNLGMRLDDALIYARYVRNALNGVGLVYNPGEHFNGLTSPLFTYLSIVAAHLAGDVPEGVNALSGVFLGATSLLWAWSFWRNGQGIEGVCGAAALALGPYFFSTFGMETTMFSFLSILAAVLFERRSSSALYLVLALLFITRSEAIFLWVVIGVEHVRQRRPLPRLAQLLPGFAIVCSVWLFNWSYYGSATPHTAMVKFWQGQSGFWGKWPRAFLDVGYQLDWYWGGSRVFVALTVGLALIGALRSRALVSFRVLLIATVLNGVTFVALNVPNYHWYYGGYYLLLVGSAGIGAGTLLQVRVGWFRLAACALCLGLLVKFGLLGKSFTAAPGPYPAYRAIGEWLAAHAAQGESVALAEIGTVGWYSGLRIIDILGLVTPQNGRFVADHDLRSWLLKDRPDLILVHDPPWVFESGAIEAELEGTWTATTPFPFPGYRLLRKVVGKPQKSLLLSLFESAPVGTSPELLSLQGSELYAHAPRELSVSAAEVPGRVWFRFGLRDGAWQNGNHVDGVCFSVSVDEVTVWRRCLHPLLAVEDQGAQRVELDLPQKLLERPGARLILRTECEQTCNWAWSYWSQFKSIETPVSP